MGETAKQIGIKIVAGLLTAGILGAIGGWFGWTALSRTTVTLSLPGDINPEKAPFAVRLDGTVTHLGTKYLYLIVDDGNAEWVQPGLGGKYDGRFYATAYLGIKDDPKSIGKWYSVYAVVSRSTHNPYQKLDRAALVAQSDIIRMYRVPATSANP